MYWEEGESEEVRSVPEDVVDISYRIQCRALPVDHAQALADALLARLAWLEADPRAGIHSIHVADSGNGWTRPDAPDDLIYPSRRTRLILRVPQARVDEALQLPGVVLDVAGNSLEIGEASVRPLSTLTTLFARYVVTEDDENETAFLESAAAELVAMGIRPRKMMCGISKTIRRSEARIRTRSLMLADLTVDDSIRLQQQGLGPYRHLGCGLFIPHKDIKQVRGGASAAGE